MGKPLSSEKLGQKRTDMSHKRTIIEHQELHDHVVHNHARGVTSVVEEGTEGSGLLRVSRWVLL